MERSGLAAKHGITCLNTPGTIDSDYRGELKVLLVNLGSDPVPIARGDRIAQLVLAPVITADPASVWRCSRITATPRMQAEAVTVFDPIDAILADLTEGRMVSTISL